MNLYHFSNISSSLNISVEETKNMIAETFSRYRAGKILQPKLLNLIKCQETTLFFEFCLENINDICRLCLRLRGDVKMSEVIDENSDNGSSDFNTKINFTLQESESVSSAKFLKSFFWSFNFKLDRRKVKIHRRLWNLPGKDRRFLHFQETMSQECRNLDGGEKGTWSDANNCWR